MQLEGVNFSAEYFYSSQLLKPYEISAVYNPDLGRKNVFSGLENNSVFLVTASNLGQIILFVKNIISFNSNDKILFIIISWKISEFKWNTNSWWNNLV